MRSIQSNESLGICVCVWSISLIYANVSTGSTIALDADGPSMVVCMTLVLLVDSLLVEVMVEDVPIAVAPMIRAPYGADFILRASRRSRRCCITKRN